MPMPPSPLLCHHRHAFLAACFLRWLAVVLVGWPMILSMANWEMMPLTASRMAASFVVGLDMLFCWFLFVEHVAFDFCSVEISINHC